MDLVFAPSQVESWPIARLRPYARNAKMHGDDQVAKIAASMAKFGWTVPCMVADDGELIAGHGRVLAATMLGLTEVPVIRLSHLDEAERRAYRIADNKLKLRDAKRYPRIHALQQDLHATRQRLAVLFGERHGWHLSKSAFSPSVLARRGLFNGRGNHVDPWPRELVDHGYFSNCRTPPLVGFGNLQPNNLRWLGHGDTS